MPNQQKKKISRQIFSRKTSHCASSGLAPKQIMTLIFFCHHIQHSIMKLLVMGRTEKLNVILR